MFIVILTTNVLVNMFICFVEGALLRELRACCIKMSLFNSHYFNGS
jgi:hypothetical protein